MNIPDAIAAARRDVEAIVEATALYEASTMAGKSQRHYGVLKEKQRLARLGPASVALAEALAVLLARCRELYEDGPSVASQDAALDALVVWADAQDGGERD